jgi:hypothetical protein
MWWRVHSRACAANRIGEAGVKEVVKALKANTTLTTLHLDGAFRGGVAASLAAAHAHTAARRCAFARVFGSFLACTIFWRARYFGVHRLHLGTPDRSVAEAQPANQRSLASHQSEQ